MDSIKEAFQKVKQDINSLAQETHSLRKSLIETRENMIEMCEIIKKLEQKNEFSTENKNFDTSTHNQENSTTSTHLSTHNSSFKLLKPQILGISTGNGGVSTDRQTDRQTHQQTQNISENRKNSVDNAAEMLDSLDNIKKELRLKFKGITNQELLVFSTIYQLEEENENVDYKVVSEKLNLTESSIRDYVGRLIKKGIPVEKKRINNKNIRLSISQNLKKIAPLSTILQLREI